MLKAIDLCTESERERKILLCYHLLCFQLPSESTGMAERSVRHSRTEREELFESIAQESVSLEIRKFAIKLYSSYLVKLGEE